MKCHCAELKGTDFWWTLSPSYLSENCSYESVVSFSTQRCCWWGRAGQERPACAPSSSPTTSRGTRDVWALPVSNTNFTKPCVRWCVPSCPVVAGCIIYWPFAVFEFFWRLACWYARECIQIDTINRRKVLAATIKLQLEIIVFVTRELPGKEQTHFFFFFQLTLSTLMYVSWAIWCSTFGIVAGTCLWHMSC